MTKTINTWLRHGPVTVLVHREEGNNRSLHEHRSSVAFSDQVFAAVDSELGSELDSREYDDEGRCRYPGRGTALLLQGAGGSDEHCRSCIPPTRVGRRGILSRWSPNLPAAPVAEKYP